jgi:murein DD-endopeptidase MepM/ murein hydrolase activator NlpD
MAVFKRSSFIPKAVTLDPQCINNPLVIELKTINNNMRRIDAYVILGLKGKKRLKAEEEQYKKQKQRRDKESNLEILRKSNPINFFRGTLPRTGFLDAIRNFILYTTMGKFVPFVLKNLPTILNATRNLVPVINFVEKFAGNVLNGVITAIDFGYKVHDKIRKIFKDVTGNKFEKTFDELSESLNTFLNIAIIAGLAISGSGAGNIFKTTKVSKPPKQVNITVKQLRKIAEEKGLKGYNKLKKQELVDLLKPHLPPAATVTPKKPTGGKFFGKFGKLFGRVPIIGGIIDFAVSLMFGEKIGRAAARAVGSTAGAFLGSFIPIPFAGTLLGGILGDIVGGALYDTLSSYGNPKKMQSGGTVGRKTSKIPRQIRAKRIQRPPKQITQRTVPGKNVGGKDQLAKLFPYSDDPNVMSPMRLLTKNTAIMKNGGIFGKFLSSGVELMALGQKIERPTLIGFEKYLAYVIDSAVQNQSNVNSKMLASTMFAMAEGGIVPASRTLSGSGDSVGNIVSKDIVKTLTATINNRSGEILQNIRKEMDLSIPSLKGGVKPEDIENESYLDGDYKELLDLIATVESKNGGYNAYNEGGAAGGYRIVGYSGPSGLGPIGRNLTDMTIAEIMNHQANKNPPIHAAGRYQIIGPTLKGLMNGSYGETGIKPTDKFSPEVQDKLAIALIRHRLSTGATNQNFINEWRGLKFVKEKELQSAIEKSKGGNIGNLKTRVSLGAASNIGISYKTNTYPNQYYGAPRPGRIHEGVDLDLGDNDSQITFLGGKVVNIDRQTNQYGRDVGYGLYVDILTPTGMIERLAELGTLDPKVKLGAILNPGQIVSRGQSFSGVTHLEYRKPGGGTINPLDYLRKLGVIEGGDTFKFKGTKSKNNEVSSTKLNINQLTSNQPKSPSIDYISNNRTYSDTTEQTRILIQPIIT